MRGYATEKRAYANRLRRIEGQLQGIERMIENDQYCLDVFTQIAASTGALHTIALRLLEDHLANCVHEAALRSSPVAEETIAEVTEVISNLVVRR